MGHHRITCIAALALAVLAFGGPVAAAQQDLRSPDTRDAASAALAPERYFSSYGAPEPVTRTQSPAPSDGTPWLPIALSAGAALAVIALSSTQLRRVRTRRRRPVGTAV